MAGSRSRGCAGGDASHVERVRKLKLHVAMFAVGMLVLMPVWALIEGQDNGGFERWSNNSQPGDWEPWILYWLSRGASSLPSRG